MKTNKLRRVLSIAVTVLSLSVVSSFSYAQGNFAGVELSITPVAGNVYMVQRPGGGGNIGVQVGPDGVLLVDSLFAPLADKLVAAVKQVTEEEIRFLVNTHIHIDHVGGNENLAERGVLIFAHDNTRLRFFEQRSRFPRAGGSFVIDIYNGGSLRGTIAAMDKAIEIAGPETKIIPGHGLEAVGRDDLVEFRDMILDIQGQVLSMILEGKKLDEVMAAQPTAAYDAKWTDDPGWGPQDFVPVVYYELGGSGRLADR